MSRWFSLRGRVAVAAALLTVIASACASTGGGGGELATTTTTTPGGGEVAAGCYDSDTSELSLIYSGPMASYKNTRLATSPSPGGCGSVPTNEWFTVVLVPELSNATAECQAGPDPAVDGALSLSALGFTSLPANAWFCGNPLSGALLQAGQCFPVGTASLQYLGPRNTKDNVTLHSGAGCVSPPAVPAYTYVQHSTTAAATAVCDSIDPAFNTASSLAGITSLPNDTYLCG